MATSAQKAPAKGGPKSVAPEAADAVAAPPKSKKKLILLIVIAVVVLSAGGGGAWYFLGSRAAAGAHPAAEAKHEVEKAPVFVVLGPFTVNLQAENGEQFLQTTFTLQVADEQQVELFKVYMPQVRSRLLLLLSGKKGAEINSVEGKKKLSEEIIAAANAPFVEKGKPQTVTNVFYTSFVIQ